MQSFVFQTNIPYVDIDSILALTKIKVKQLRKDHPELKECHLADVNMQRKGQGVDVTLYFAPKSHPAKVSDFSLSNS